MLLLNQHHQPMDIAAVLFLFFVALGAMVQTITGFAMGLIVIGGVTALALADIGVTAAVISLISLVNTGLALRSTYKSISWIHVKQFSLGSLPMVLVGVWLLEYLSAATSEGLARILGAVIIFAGTLLMLKPTPYAALSGRGLTVFMAAMGGFMGGLYGASGAPLAYHMYRQPLDISMIRATLLASFAVSTLFRTLVAIAVGQVDWTVIRLTLLSVPIVVAVTLISSHFAHRMADALIRKLVFILLILLGLFLILR